MRKQELVHLHALCTLVRSHVEARSEVPPGTFDEYEQLCVTSTSIYRRKRAHRRGVTALLDGVTSAVRARNTGHESESDTGGPTGEVGRNQE